MKSRRNLLPYLILNIIVSAVTTLIVLGLWDRAQSVKAVRSISNPGAAVSTVQTQDVEGTPRSQGEVQIEIENVFGAGDVQNEVVVVKQTAEGEVWLTGWRLQDQNGNVYTFPALLLSKGGAVQVYTRAGADSVIELHWGLGQAVWQSGEVAMLLDEEGSERARFVVP